MELVWVIHSAAACPALQHGQLTDDANHDQEGRCGSRSGPARLLLAGDGGADEHNEVSRRGNPRCAGEGLHVKHASGSIDEHINGSKFRLYTVYQGTRKNLTRWKYAEFVSAGMTKFARPNWKLDRRFRNGTWLCVENNIKDGSPCARIHP